MSRRILATAFSVVLTALMMPSIHAEDLGSATNAAPPLLIPPPLLDQPAPVIPGQGSITEQGSPNGTSYLPISTPATNVSNLSNLSAPTTAPTPIDANLVQGNQAASGFPPQQQGYVRLGAPLYPTPRPNIPVWSGATVVTNQAFAPHEMLYPHTYKAIYPPYYHRVKGGWILTPLGVRSHERWELQGTTVEVNYRSSYPGFFSGAFWHPPVSQSTSTHCR